mgnify:CR=1 FL=1
MSQEFRAADGVLFQTVADEAVLLNIDDNRYYGLDDIATRMWTLLMEHGDEETVIRQMLEEYEVEEPVLRQDFVALVAEMEQSGLIVRVDGRQGK